VFRRFFVASSFFLPETLTEPIPRFFFFFFFFFFLPTRLKGLKSN